MTETDSAPATAPQPRRVRRGTLVLAVLACAAILFGLGQLAWLHARTRGLAGTDIFIAVQGSDAAPVVTALALVAAAAAFTYAIGRRMLALGSSAVIALAGLLVVLAVAQALTNPAGAAAGAVAENTGILGAALQVTPTAWPYPAGGVGVVLAAVGVVASRTALRLDSGAPTRYARDASTAGKTQRIDSAAAWDSLSHGDDPTL